MRPSSFNKIHPEKVNYQIQDDFQTTIQFQFDYMARKVMIRTKSNYRRSIGRRRRHESLFSEVSDLDINKLHTTDTYRLDRRFYKVLSMDVQVTDCQIAEALDTLSKRKRDIILMFYFLEMSDAEIAKELSVNRSTVYRNRHSALEMFKTLLEDEP
ncbi:MULTISPECIES: RNA polymerase sigma factor [Sporolactobacillus]|nr:MULTISPECIES: sigma-70 family RNA polymerase sigma factor [Sporolactobacillus]GEB76768.1 DNA-binding protein [Sporolactobacillus inulinus]SFG59625.1 RNA polymerase sigma factor, sigma-70 family [Sporolactobacillus nakayamae]